MRGELKSKLLEILNEASYAASELFGVFLLSPADLYKKRNEILNGPSDRLAQRKKIKNRTLVSNIFNKDRRRFYDIVYNLKKDNLINVKEKNGLKYISITNLGRKILNKLKRGNKYRFDKYIKIQDNEYKLVIFDIPEKYRSKRRWLCRVLKYLGFKMLQRSVWLGKVKLSKDFFTDLKDLGMISYIEIFTINKEGVLRLWE